jgi:hypothetical protein
VSPFRLADIANLPTSFRQADARRVRGLQEANAKKVRQVARIGGTWLWELR